MFLTNISISLLVILLGVVQYTFASISVSVYSLDQMYNGGSINESQPRIYVKNTGTEAITNVIVYYYFTVEDSRTPILEDYYTPGLISPSLENLGNQNYRVKIDFGSTSIAVGQNSPDNSGLIIGLHYNDHTPAWNYLNDHSNPRSNTHAINNNIECYVNGNLICGNGPDFGIYALNVNVNGLGHITKTPQKDLYSDGEIVTLTAIPNSGYVFKQWGGDVSSSANPISITVNGNKSVNAIFILDEIIARKIVATEVVVTPKWQIPPPDYVFDSTYNLPSIKDVDKYIKCNKHLQDIPSAKDLQSNGVNVADMNMKLLKKIEELTLYIIQLNQKIEEINKNGQN